MDKIKVGLIGLGFMGTTHFDIYKKLKNVEVVAKQQLFCKAYLTIILTGVSSNYVNKYIQIHIYILLYYINIRVHV